jgi:hypothetical protein
LEISPEETGNGAMLKELNDAIAQNGVTMKQSTATIAGTVALANGHAQLRVSGSNEMLELIPDASAAPVPATLAEKPVLVEANIPKGEGKSPNSIRYPH